ncbi:MAG UNVERIFIED_CONTAM: 16S rRNA (guanine(527)-N(7))-methyltransferase RsmG [Rickettsiaceae bacterium]|jgi:16S rRNA (guanine527-N7)-methyltransferase
MLEKLDVSCGTKEKIQSYIDILTKWNEKINLISKNSLLDIWERHILDSAQIMKFVSKKDTIIDIGSGAGLPGIVLSILGIETLIMIEADARKASFLTEVSRQLNLNTQIINDRVENIHIQGDVSVARGFSSVNNIFKCCANIQTKKFLLLKGKNVELEITEARKNWLFSCQKHKSITSIDSFILEISNVHEKH